MGKEKELLKAILANTERIMDHLGIGKPKTLPAAKAAPKKSVKAPAKKATRK